MSDSRCYKCGQRPAFFTWNICALGKEDHYICEEHDIELNKIVLDFMEVIGKNRLIKDYKKKIHEEYSKKIGEN